MQKSELDSSEGFGNAGNYGGNVIFGKWVLAPGY